MSGWAADLRGGAEFREGSWRRRPTQGWRQRRHLRGSLSWSDSNILVFLAIGGRQMHYFVMEQATLMQINRCLHNSPSVSACPAGRPGRPHALVTNEIDQQA